MQYIGKVFYSCFILTLLSVGVLLLGIHIPIFGGIELKIVQSGSMEPEIPVGSLLIVRAVDTYKVGDVITFGPDTKKQIPTTHRIIEETKNNGVTQFTTKGDANTVNDEKPVYKKDIIGKVVLSVPKLGFVLDFAREPLGFLFLIGIPAGLIVFDEVIVIVREIIKIRTRKRRAFRKEMLQTKLEQNKKRLAARAEVRPRRATYHGGGLVVRLESFK